jgi:hypothetical protein
MTRLAKIDLKTLKKRSRREAKSLGKDWREIYKFYKNMYEHYQQHGDAEAAQKYAKQLHLLRHYRDQVNHAVKTKDIGAMQTLARGLKEALED